VDVGEDGGALWGKGGHSVHLYTVGVVLAISARMGFPGRRHCGAVAVCAPCGKACDGN
jgi:hypothetical protein